MREAFSCPDLPDKKHQASARCGKPDTNSPASGLDDRFVWLSPPYGLPEWANLFERLHLKAPGLQKTDPARS